MNERYVNKLSNEKSPYLLQHAHNPVDWHPWDRGAFEEAKRRDVPLFISIGYSTCHWCHVMAHESFDNEKVAKLLNEGFVPVKVDREERPDVDSAYMKGCQMATGGGGWPLTVIATPDGKPFFFGTYIPRESIHGRRGLLDLLPRVTEMWRKNRKDLLRSSEALSAEMSKKDPGGDKYDPGWIEIAYRNMKNEFDADHKGFGTSPKFPMPHRIIFLLRYWFSTNDEKALNMAKDTLEAMRLGGIYDQVGGGFHRYSTDRMWRLPHFEKMLYDQATHLMAYTEGWQATRDSLFSRSAEEIVDYVLDDLGDPSGCFHSSEDADTEGVEGKYYTWSEEELAEVLGRDRGRDFMTSFGISSGGNFAEEATGKKTGRNVLHPINRKSIEGYPGELKKLKEVRNRRKRPFKDDKILTDWNGLFLTALSRAGRVFRRDDWLDRAEKGLDFILNQMRSDNGALIHRYRSGDASGDGFLDDYSFVILALLETYRGTGRKRYLAESIELAERMVSLFWDEEEGGLYNRSPDEGQLPFLDKEAYDGAKPSGNSAASMALLRLSRLTGDQRYEKISDRIIRHFSKEVDSSPQSYSYLLSSMLHATGESREIILVGDQNDDNTLKMRYVIDSIYDPFQVVVFKYSGSEGIDEIVPYASEAEAINGIPTAYVCREFNCDVPLQDPRELERSLKGSPGGR